MCEPKPGPRCAADTRQTCDDAQCTYRDAHPAGPDVNPVAAAEAAFDVHHHDESAVSLDELGIETGDCLVLSDHELGGGTPFSQIEVMHDEHGYRAVASVPFDFTEVVPDGEDPDNYLNERAVDIEAFLADRYGAELGGGDSWAENSDVQFTVPLDPTKDRSDDLLERCETEPAIRLHNELNGGFGTRSFPAQLREHLEQRDSEVAEAQRAYEVAALWAGVGYDEGEDDGYPLDSKYSTDDIAEETRDKIRTDVRRFTSANRTLIAQAAQIAEARGESYGPDQVGHDLVLTRQHHGVGFWDRGLGDVGKQLTDAADRLGDVSYYPGDDGKIYA